MLMKDFCCSWSGSCIPIASGGLAVNVYQKFLLPTVRLPSGTDFVTRSVCEGDKNRSKCDKDPRSRFGLLEFLTNACVMEQQLQTNRLWR